MSATLNRPLTPERVALVLRDISDASAALVKDYPRAHSLLLDWSGPALGGSGNGSRGSGHSDPTERAAVASTPSTDKDGRVRPGVPIDQAGEMLKARDAELVKLQTEMRDFLTDTHSKLLDFRERHYALHHATLGITDPKVIEGPECALCARFQTHRAVLETSKAPDDTKALARCADHLAFLKKYGKDGTPPVQEWLAQHPGEETPPRLVKQEHPDLYAIFHGTNWARGGKGRVAPPVHTGS